MAISAGQWVFTFAACFFCSVWTWYQLRYYARRDTPAAYFAAVFISWWFGIVAVVVLLPLDLSAAVYGSEYISDDKPSDTHNLVQVLWKINYWLTFIWCWLVCPIVMEYWAAGEFTFRGKLRSALRHNVKFYAYACSGLLLLGVFVAISHGFGPAAVAGYLVAAANCYGMLLIVLMIGYGIVDVPRELWLRANPAKQLRHLEFRAANVESCMLDAKCDLEDSIRSVNYFKSALQERQGMLTPEFEFNSRIVYAKADAAKNLPGVIVTDSSYQSTVEEFSLSNEGLAELHYRLKRAIVMYERAVYQWEHLLTRSLELEAIVAEGSPEQPYQRLTSGSVDSETSSVLLVPWRSFFRKLNCNSRGLVGLFRVLAVATVILSSILLWCECVSPINENFSLYAVLLDLAGTSGMVQLYSCMSILYMSACAYVALFKFKYLEELALHGDAQTDVYCLLYNASYFGRLQFSLGVNYLSMLRTKDAENTAFATLVGDMDVVPFLGTSFNNYIPLVIVALAICTMFKALDRVLNKIGIETITTPQEDISEHQERIDEGRNLIQRTRTRRIQREARSLRNESLHRTRTIATT
mmetsp:Transcript_7202/g.9381  ORF Transcript_7202/g.9381 Transcript_7202/m.9381 type:complete len:582 (+) Transcript_7202:74-1819(+)|eukprot:CAMPEP_0184024390 /NCGR_PEP_ID=MMETSP0954-20121128/12050_1 /TAXON_ID=627963 /ORGANISM="Aplanochytrium sp, Strain PBS07" /LENGTH=581 /DNA_ID=CAMNT_0026307701 /DNA_START=143 /DNA_END=1888 /DNA_ORIENTATION=+